MLTVMAETIDRSSGSAPLALTPGAEKAFDELQQSHCSPWVCDELRRLITSGTDLDCYKINAVRVAKSVGVTAPESLRTFLFATRLGILDLNYDIYCPACQGTTDYSKQLMGLTNTGHCDLCVLDFAVDFFEQVEVTFTVNPDIRQIEVIDFSQRDKAGQFDYLNAILSREGRQPLMAELFEPGQTKTLQGELAAGNYLCYLPVPYDSATVLSVEGQAAASPQSLDITARPDGEMIPERIELNPGPVEIAIHYELADARPIQVLPRGAPANWLSAAYVTSQQDYRDLFAGEFLAPGMTFAIRNTTLMFTDIERSTELFEELGDSAAYALVQDHFAIMTDIIRAHQGGVVKTIGDAVMAAFPVNRKAVAAAWNIQRSFLRRPIQGRYIGIKIGVHRGPVIAVTSNRNLDYFGRTVNIASRIGSQCKANQILLSDPVLDDSRVQTVLADLGASITSFVTSLRGIEDEIQVHAIAPRSS